MPCSCKTTALKLQNHCLSCTVSCTAIRTHWEVGKAMPCLTRTCYASIHSAIGRGCDNCNTCCHADILPQHCRTHFATLISCSATAGGPSQSALSIASLGNSSDDQCDDAAFYAIPPLGDSSDDAASYAQPLQEAPANPRFLLHPWEIHLMMLHLMLSHCRRPTRAFYCILGRFR